MGRQGNRLTNQEEQFARLVALEQESYTSAFRLAYPKRQAERSAEGERVAAKKIARRPLVQQRMAELRAELEASDPIELRRKASGALARILSGQLDPRYRVAAITTLRYLDGQERAAARNDREALRTITAQMAALDAMESRATKSTRSHAVPPTAAERPPVDVDQIIAEIESLARVQQRDREHDALTISPPKSSLNDVPEAAERAIPIEADNQAAPPPAAGFQLVRQPGSFGTPRWMRVSKVP
jgi:hypothetical protein